MFYDYSNLISLKGLNNFITDNVTSIDYIICDCSNLMSLDLSNFKTDNVTNMGDVFDGYLNLKEY